MNDQNKDNFHRASPLTAENIIYNGQSSLKLSYLEYLKQQYTNELQGISQPQNLHDHVIQEEPFKCREKWKFIKKLEAEPTNISENRVDNYVKMEIKPELEKPQKNNIFKEYDKQISDVVKGKLEETEDKEVEGFVWIQDQLEKNIRNMQWKLRKYFLQNPEYDEAKHKDGNDDMMNGHVLEDRDLIKDFQVENKLKQGLIEIAAGSLAGMVQVYVSQPFDTVKVKQQTFPKLYKNMFKCFMQIYRKDGISLGLYAGSLPAVVASVAENSVLFAAYGGCQDAVAFIMEIDKVSEMSALGNACAGFFAAFFSTFALCPTELVKCKLQAIQEMKQYLAKDSKVVPITAFKLTKHIFLTEGLPGFYRGLTSTFVREMPGYFFFFGGYEATREYFTEPGQSKEDIGPLKTMCAGAIGGIALWTTTFPADVIKSRIQINNLKSTMISVGSEILRKEGVLAFYNGLFSSILRTIPATAALFLVYEYTKKALNNTM